MLRYRKCVSLWSQILFLSLTKFFGAATVYVWFSLSCVTFDNTDWISITVDLAKIKIKTIFVFESFINSILCKWINRLAKIKFHVNAQYFIHDNVLYINDSM